jgi:hypothetical protein
VAEHVQRGLDLDRPGNHAEQLVGRLELVIDPLRAVRVAVSEALDHLLHLRPDHVCVDADAAAAADLEERIDDVVVARIEVETELDDPPRLFGVRVRLLDRGHVRDLGERRHRVGLDVDDNPRGDVVDHHRPVRGARDRLEVRDDPARRRLVVVRRHDEHRVGAGLMCLLGQVDRVLGRVRACPGNHGRAVADGVERGAEQLQPLLVREGRRLTCRSGHDYTVRAVVDEVPAELGVTVRIDATVRVERRHRRGDDLAEHRRKCRGHAPAAQERLMGQTPAGSDPAFEAGSQ